MARGVAGQYRFPLAMIGAVVGSAGAAVVRVQVLDQAGAGSAQRDGPGAGDAVGVAGVGQDVAERDAAGWHRGEHAGQFGGGVVAGLATVIRRASARARAGRPRL